MTRRAGEDGVTVVIGAALSGLAVLVAVAVAAGIGVIVAQRRAQSAADLAALAGAAAWLRGEDGCAASERIAHAHRSRVTSCGIVADGLALTAEVALGGPFAGATVSARARAGPG